MTDTEAEQLPERFLPETLTSGNLNDYLPIHQAKAELMEVHNGMLFQAFDTAGLTPSDDDHTETVGGVTTRVAKLKAGDFTFHCGTAYSKESDAGYIYLTFIGHGDWPTLRSCYTLSDTASETVSNQGGFMGTIDRQVTGSAEELVAQLADDITLCQNPLEFLQDKLAQSV